MGCWQMNEKNEATIETQGLKSNNTNLNDFFKSKQNGAANDYFEKHLSRGVLNKLFPIKEITSIRIHFVKHCDYQKGDVISNINGMTIITIEFNDHTIGSIRWKDTPNKSIIDTNKVVANDYFKKYFSRGELNKFFPNKEITYIETHYIRHSEYKKGDMISNINDMTKMTIEFDDNTKESIRWVDDLYTSISYKNIDDSQDEKELNAVNSI